MEELREKREDILSIAFSHGAKKIGVFGSAARGEDNCESDIDFLVDMEKGKTIIDRIALLQDLQNFLGRKVDVISARSLRDRVKSNVYRDYIAF